MMREIKERLAWINHGVADLQTEDLVRLKFSLDDLLALTDGTLQAVRAELRAQRKVQNRIRFSDVSDN